MIGVEVHFRRRVVSFKIWRLRFSVRLIWGLAVFALWWLVKVLIALGVLRILGLI